MSHQALPPGLVLAEQMVGEDCPCRFMPISCCTKCILCGTDAGGLGVTCNSNILACLPSHLWRYAGMVDEDSFGFFRSLRGDQERSGREALPPEGWGCAGREGVTWMCGRR